ncbi:MAG: TetR/AcrR family transcriptional regulator [Myxococcota bacterium]
MAYKKSEISAAQIVDAAMRVLARQGYARTSLLDIAREAGMSKGALHYHFPTKEALIQVVLEAACDRVQARTLEAWSPADGAFVSLRRSLATLWEVRAARSSEALVIADLLSLSLNDPALRPQLAKFYAHSAAQVQSYLEEQLLPLGLRPKVDLAVLPRLVIGLLDGLVMQVFVDPAALTPTQVVTAVETLALGLFEPQIGKR